MRRLASIAAVALLAACAQKEEAPAGPTLTDFAGTWETTTMLTGVENPVASTLSSNADGTVWTMGLEGRDPIPMAVAIKGDSLIAETGEYESILRAGVMVTVRTAAVLHDGMMMGTLVATYRTPDGPEIVTGTLQGTRKM